MAIFTMIPAIGTWLTATFGANLGAALVALGKSALWTLTANALNRPKLPRQQVQAQINEADAPRVMCVGLNMLSGVRALWEADGGTLHQIIVTHHGPLTSLEGWVVDGEPVTVDANGKVTNGAGEGFLTLKSILSGNGGDYADARAALPGVWTTDHKLTGLATIYAKMKKPDPEEFGEVFPRGDQTTIAGIFKGPALYDPRDGQPRYSANGALAIRHYLTHPDCYRIPASKIDDASFSAKANRDAQAVALKAGGTAPRYQVCGHWTLEDAPKDVLGRMTLASDASLYQTPEGKIGIIGGAWSEPDVTITEDDILGHSLKSGTDPFTDFNVLKGIYVSPRNKFQNTEVREWTDAASLATQPRRVETLEADMCPSGGQMQRLMKIYRARALRQWTGTITTNLVGLKARFPKGGGIHTIKVRIPEMGIDGPFEVLGHSYDVASRTCRIEIASIWNAWAWNAATEETDPPAEVDDLPKVTPAPAVPQGFALAQEVIKVSETEKGVRIVATAMNPNRPDLRLKVQWRPVSATAEAWEERTAPISVYTVRTPVLSDNTEYEVRAGWVGKATSRTSGDGTPVDRGWTAVTNITVLANPITPDAPTWGTVTAAAGRQITLSWTSPPQNVTRVRIFRNTTNDFAGASAVATVSVVPDQTRSYTDTAPVTGGYYYWLVSLNASLVASAPTAARSVTAIA